jgi:hypothetical protein
MVTKTRSGSERVKPGSGDYLASERAKRSGQGAFASHPEGMALPAHRIVEALARRARYVLRASPRAASGRSHVTAPAGGRFGP